ncbi:6-phosphogluconate dehydrogenase [Urechidicola croceus]|uniref:6-phosphogluconate dehydrogenase n=1 Tax=Urechidicola croceus TaxID=1850246 RepID=A0A1D8PC45_9FLAO|nr:6-phosphogluconate dehydrogenase [Urechidicola croceus]AOW22085.1 6-phosphogluconate dehydrogenase [Urechidicola croceus]
MKKIALSVVGILLLVLTLYFVSIYYITYSEGYRAGELVKFSHKGIIFKTWEGEISQGVSEAQRFSFSVEDNEKDVIKDLQDLQGKDVKLTYKERFGTFPWLGDTKYFITKVEKTE